jgi:hypothetical protein
MIMFNLEQSIAEWREQMLAAGIKTPVPLVELEIHLREEIEQQTKSGLSEQDAFNSAVQKIGRGGLLKKEFARAGGFLGWFGDGKTKTVKIMKRIGISAAIMVLLVAVCCGCAYTSNKLTGTKGASYSGFYRMADMKPTERQPESGTLPDSWWQSTLYFGGPKPVLEECEYRKTDTNATLVLTVKTHGFKGVIAAPPGTTAVRVVHDGDKYKTETF